jgi:hypothetical protein
MFDLRVSTVGSGGRLARNSHQAPLEGLHGSGEVSMFAVKKDIQAMMTFRRSPGKFMKRLKKPKNRWS